MALFHTELGRDGPGLLYRDIVRGNDPQIEAGLRILDHIDADILVLSDIDYDHANLALGAFADRLGEYPYRFHPETNRGFPTGLDLNRNGRLGDPDDALGYGEFRGSGALAVLSRFPIGTDRIVERTDLAWLDLAGHIAPEGTTPIERISTSAHLRVPIDLPGDESLVLVIWHATPPVFDGPEDRNGRRNRDEAKLALDLVEGAKAPVVVAAFTNLDPVDGEGRPDALQALLNHPQLLDRPPISDGGREAASKDGGVNNRQSGDPEQDTVDWPDEDGRPGNLRSDILVPDRAFRVLRSGVFWPKEGALFSRDVRDASRHRIVWMDLVLDGPGQSGDRIGHSELRQ